MTSIISKISNSISNFSLPKENRIFLKATTLTFTLLSNFGIWWTEQTYRKKTATLIFLGAASLLSANLVYFAFRKIYPQNPKTDQDIKTHPQEPRVDKDTNIPQKPTTDQDIKIHPQKPRIDNDTNVPQKPKADQDIKTHPQEPRVDKDTNVPQKPTTDQGLKIYPREFEIPKYNLNKAHVAIVLQQETEDLKLTKEKPNFERFLALYFEISAGKSQNETGKGLINFINNIKNQNIDKQTEVFTQELTKLNFYVKINACLSEIISHVIEKPDPILMMRICRTFAILSNEKHCPITYNDEIVSLVRDIRASWNVVIETESLEQDLLKVAGNLRVVIPQLIAKNFGRQQTHTVLSVMRILDKHMYLPDFSLYEMEDKQADIKPAEYEQVMAAFWREYEQLIVDHFYTVINQKPSPSEKKKLSDQKITQSFLERCPPGTDITSFMANFYDLETGLIFKRGVVLLLAKAKILTLE